MNMFFVAYSKPHVWAELQDQLANMFNSANIKELALNFDKRIKVTTDTESNLYSNVQAELVIKNFLSKLEDRKFCCIKRLDIDADTFYITGKLNSTQGNYKIFIFISDEDEAEIIREIKFEKI